MDLCTVKLSAKAHELADVCLKDPRIVELILQESLEVLRCIPNVLSSSAAG